MSIDHRSALTAIRRFDQLIAYLRDEMDWPIERGDFVDDDDLFYDFTPEELGIDTKNAAKIREIRRLRPLSVHQPWGIFFVMFEPKRLPVVALRRILSRVALKKRASSNSAERAAWSADDLLFVSNYGEADHRHITFAHFSQNEAKKDLPTLKVLGWDNRDTALHLDHVAESLTERLSWPEDEEDEEGWRSHWHSAFTLVNREVITTSKMLSVELASLARNIRDRINTVLDIETESGPVSKLMAAFKEALVHDLDKDGFADMYAQTIAYGLLSARVANPERDNADGVAEAMPVTNPFLKELMGTFLDVGGRKGKAGKGPGLDFDELGVSDVVELLDVTKMDLVVRDFRDRNPQEDPLIHFYELFLNEFNQEQKKRLGAFYTPWSVVTFIVRSVDEMLRTEFGLEDGLADTTTWGEMVQRIEGLQIPDGATSEQAFVQILDPATGTGTFLVETIDLIYRTMKEKWTKEAGGLLQADISTRWNEYVPKHLLPRLHGYEIQMAPYATAHISIGLKLLETGYRFEADERARVYLTNALDPAQDFSARLSFAIPALAREAEAVNAIKRDHRFTVVIGNPPYSYMSANLTEAAASLIEPFRYVDGERIKERSALSLERSLQDDFVKFIGLGLALRRDTGRGYVLGLITNNSYMDSPLHRGVRAEILKYLPQVHLVNLFGDGIKDKEENVFDIVQGVAVLLGSALATTAGPHVRLSELHGRRVHKYEALAGLDLQDSSCFCVVEPSPPQRYFLSLKHEDEYLAFPSIVEVFPLTSTCIKTLKDDLATGTSKEELRDKVEYFRDASNPKRAIINRFGVKDVVQWKIDPARRAIRGVELDDFLQLYQARPFDYRWMFYHESIVGSPRKAVMRNLIQVDNHGLIVNRKIRTGQCKHFWVTSRICVSEVISSADNSNCFPLFIAPDESGLSFGEAVRPNLAASFLRRLSSALGVPQATDGIPKGLRPIDVFQYVYAVFHSPTYRHRYADSLRLDFPRLPLPGSLELLQNLAQSGKELIALHTLDSSELEHYTTALVGLGRFQVEKVSYSDETVWVDKAKTRGFKGVPEEVWNFHVGGYQVCNKWLKDRQAKGGKNPRPGRVLTDEDIDHYQKIVVAISETIRIMEEIDDVIEAHGGWPRAFQSGDASTEG